MARFSRDGACIDQDTVFIYCFSVNCSPLLGWSKPYSWKMEVFKTNEGRLKWNSFQSPSKIEWICPLACLGQYSVAFKVAWIQRHCVHSNLPGKLQRSGVDINRLSTLPTPERQSSGIQSGHNVMKGYHFYRFAIYQTEKKDVRKIAIITIHPMGVELSQSSPPPTSY